MCHNCFRYAAHSCFFLKKVGKLLSQYSVKTMSAVWEPYLYSTGWNLQPRFIFDVLMAKPKSISLTRKGCLRWSTSIMLSSFRSLWVTPMLFSASSAVATCKYTTANTSQRISPQFQQISVSLPIWQQLLCSHLLDVGSDEVQLHRGLMNLADVVI